MGVGEFLIKLCWVMMFFYVVKNIIDIIKYCIKKMEICEKPIDNSYISTKDFKDSDYEHIDGE